MKIENLKSKKGIIPSDVARYFIAFANETGDLLTNLKLQKLVYYCQAWNIAVNVSYLFEDDFEAWVHGPVLRKLYDEYKQFGSKPIIDESLGESFTKEFDEELPENVKVIFDDVREVYFPRTAYELEQMTHQESPWVRARTGLQPYEPSNKIIEKSWMGEYYSSLLKNDAA